MLTQMNEQLAKELKKCDKEAIKSLKKHVNGPRASRVGIQILDKISQIISNNEAASFSKEGMDIIDDFSSSAKKSDPANMSKEYLSALAKEITTNSEQQRGKILNELMDAGAA